MQNPMSQILQWRHIVMASYCHGVYRQFIKFQRSRLYRQTIQKIQLLKTVFSFCLLHLFVKYVYLSNITYLGLTSCYYEILFLQHRFCQQKVKFLSHLQPEFNLAKKDFKCYLTIVKIGPFPASFSFRLFNTVF